MKALMTRITSKGGHSCLIAVFSLIAMAGSVSFIYGEISEMNFSSPLWVADNLDQEKLLNCDKAIIPFSGFPSLPEPTPAPSNFMGPGSSFIPLQTSVVLRC
jgi:hypothetical protein